MQEDLQVIFEEPEIASFESDDQESHEAKGSKLAALVRIRGSQGYFLGLTFVVGLLLGWMVIGWWLWPVQWTNSEPWHLHPEHQRTFVGLVAGDLWLTNDVSRAREALAGWDDEALGDLLTAMQAQASSAEERQHLEALAEALELPEAEVSLLTSLLDQKVIILGAIVSVLPLVMAIFLAVSPRVRGERQPAEELLFDEQLEELEELLAQEGEEGEAQRRQGEQQQEEKEQEELQAEREEEEEEYEEDDEEDELVPEVQDLVFSLLDDEESALPELEALCKNLPDIDASDLLEHSRKVAHDLSRSSALRYGRIPR